MRKLSWTSPVTILLAGLVTLGGCASGGYYARAPIPPPPPGAFVNRGPAPGIGFVWRDGYYNWNGERYNWIGGGWVRAPRGRTVWVNPGWRGRRWRGGYWH